MRYHGIQLTRHLRLVGLLLGLVLAPACAWGAGAWEQSPYRIHVLVAVKSEAIDSRAAAQRIVQHLRERSDASVGALWDLTIEVVDPQSTALVTSLASGQRSDYESLPASESKFDKLILVSVRQDRRGIEVHAVEHDIPLMRWGPPHSAHPASLAGVPESAFRLSVEVFSPVARFQMNPDDPKLADLSFRGARLPARPGSPEWMKPGDIFLPMLRRMSREGTTDSAAVRQVPWTYLHVIEKEDGLTSEFVSHTRRPLASRKRGRVEYLALRLPRQRGETVLRVHDKDDPAKPLVGYHVFTQDGDGPRELVGSTGVDGRITIPPGESPFLMTYVKTGALLIAKLPVVPGSVAEMQVPLLDETPRLNAEAKLGLMREDLIDLVAQRQLYIARIDLAIAEKQLEKAAGLIEELERLPASRILSQKLRQLEQSSRSKVPMVQKRIDRMFADTRTVLDSFLDTDEIQAAKNRLKEARK